MKQKMAIAIVILICGFAYTYFYEYEDFQTTTVVDFETKRKETENQINQRKAEVKQLKDFSQNIDKIKIELREISAQLESALEYLPRTFNLSILLRRLTSLAQNSGLDLYAFKPSVTEEKEAGSFFSSIALDVDLKGTFPQVLLFLDQVSRLKRIVNPDDIKMSMEGVGNLQGAVKDGPAVVIVSAKMKTYRFSD